MDAVPERIHNSLVQRERANEVVVRLFQLAIVILFSVLYGLAAKPGQGTEFQPVPFVLGAYMFAAVFGLVWSARSRLPDWAVFFSILLDFGLLYSLMVSFHYQYEQPASFILKAPTLLYVFIFIALRALRQEWKFVAAAGGIAAVGWLLIVVYVINFEEGNSMITRSYVEYLTSNSILIGAEIDKIISILLVTGVLALAVNASSNLLVTAVTEETVAKDFSRFFDKRIAQDIRDHADLLEAGHGERRTLAIINVDIRGFSKLAVQKEPAEIMQMLSAYQGRIVPVLQDKGAVIDKFMGDGIMAIFGIDDNELPFCRMAVEACEAILADTRRWKAEAPVLVDDVPIKIGIAVASGTVSFGAVGQSERLEMTVIGTPVNTSAKLEKHNKVLGTECIVQREVWECAVREGYAGALEAEFAEAEIDGIAAPQSIAILNLSN